MSGMSEPLALVFYEKLLPGQQIVNRLQDLGYRVQTLTNAAVLKDDVQKLKPMLLITEFPNSGSAVDEAIQSIKQTPETAHVAILAYISAEQTGLRDIANLSGADLIASETELLDQLPQLLDQVLRLD